MYDAVLDESLCVVLFANLKADEIATNLRSIRNPRTSLLSLAVGGKQEMYLVFIRNIPWYSPLCGK
jgi:hypothetical protein